MATSLTGSTRKKTLTPKTRIRLARDLWGWVPHPTQKEWLLDDHPVKVAACGRRWGKTEAAAVDVATFAIAEKGSVQMIIAPTYDQSKLISRTVERLILDQPETRRNVQIIRTPYPDIRYLESRVMARTADDDGRNLRGHSADRVIVDEAAFVRDEVVEEVIGPMLADRNGRLVMISTPFGKNHFYRAFMSGQSDSPRVRSFRFPSWANPHISREYIESQRTILTDRQFKVEYEAEFVDDQNSVFPWEDIQSAVGQIYPGSGIRIAGIDWARYTDYTAVVILEVGERCQVLALDRFNRMDWHSQVRRAADFLSAYKVVALAADQTSAGDPVLEMLREALWRDRALNIDIEGVVFTNQSKRGLIDNLAVRLAHREIGFPNDERLIRELQFYEYELTQSGNVRTGARRGYHDDCVIALALAVSLAPKYRFAGDFRTSGRLRMSARP